MGDTYWGSWLKVPDIRLVYATDTAVLRTKAGANPMEFPTDRNNSAVNHFKKTVHC